MTTKLFLCCALGLALVACENETPEDGVEVAPDAVVEAEGAIPVDVDRARVAYSLGAGNEAAVTETLEPYLQLKDALFDEDLPAAKDAAQTFLDRWTTVNIQSWPDEARLFWNGQSERIAPAITTIAQAGTINTARTAFSNLTDPYANTLRALGAGGQDLYIQYCPMAFDNTGASWISKDPVIRNPYFGDEMPTCGRLTDTLEYIGG